MRRSLAVTFPGLLSLMLALSCAGPVERSIPCGILDTDTADHALPEIDEMLDTDDVPDEEPDGWPEFENDEDVPREPFIVQWGSVANEAGVAAVAAVDGAVYVTGGTTGDIGSNSGQGSSDTFLSKLGPSREVLWTRQWGTSNFDQGLTLTMGSVGEVYLAGSRDGVVDPFTGAGIGQMFISRFTKDGEEEWTREWGSLSQGYQEYPASATVDRQGDIYVTGWTYGTIGAAGNQGLSDIFLSRFAPDGAERWSVQWGSGLIDVGYGVVAAGEAGLYVTGWTYGKLDLDRSVFGGNDVFLARVNASGGVLWTRQWGSYEEDKSFAIAVGSDGGVFLAGQTSGSLGSEFPNKGLSDNFLVKYSASGERLWLYQWGSAGNDVAYAVAVAPDGKVYVSGYTEGSLGDVANKGGKDIFLTAVSANGAEEWTTLYGTPEDDGALSMCLFDGWAVIAGWTAGTLGEKSAGDHDAVVIYHPVE